jgi:hypothetical protein
MRTYIHVYPEGEPYKVYGGTDRYSTIIPSLNAVKHNLTFSEVDRTNGFEEFIKESNYK